MASEGANGVEEQPTSSTPTPPETETTTVSPSKTASPVKEIDTKNLAVNFLLQGKRHLVVKDFQSAIESLGESCRLLTEGIPDGSSTVSFEGAEAHFFYGKALLEQSRLELGVLEGPELGQVDAVSEEENSEEENEDEDDDDDEESEEADAVAAPGSSEAMEAESSEATANGTSEAEGASSTSTAKKPATESSTTTPQESAVTSSNEAGKSKPEGQQETEVVDLNVPSPSVTSGIVIDNEQPSTSSGLTAEAVAEKQAEEELSNLELAWEVLEVAKIGYRVILNEIAVLKDAFNDKTDEEEKKKLLEKEKMIKKRLADTHCSLGEVATESENYNQAIDEFETGLKILDEIEGSDSREIAQYYFQMGLAFSFDKKFPQAITSFKKSVEIIETRISLLKNKIENKQTAKDLGVELEDGSKTEVDEVQELTQLLPELQEKITDTIDAEKESQAMEEEDQKEKEIIQRNSPVKNPNPPMANDISHLVKKKKKAEEAAADEPPGKKICTEAPGSSTVIVKEVVTTNGNGEKAPVPETAAPAATNGHAPAAIEA